MEISKQLLCAADGRITGITLNRKDQTLKQLFWMYLEITGLLSSVFNAWESHAKWSVCKFFHLRHNQGKAESIYIFGW